MTDQRPTTTQLRVALEHAGCTCNPDLEQTRPGHLTIAHDDCCPAIAAPRAAIVTTPTRGRALELVELLRRGTDATVLLVTDDDDEP